MIRSDKTLNVLYKGIAVGKLVLTPDHYAAFQYDPSWIKNGFSISPFSLPLNDTVFVPKNYVFDGLFGVFADSLPDAWGRLVLDRMLASKGIKSSALDILDRLAIIGHNGMGALEYVPEYNFDNNESRLTIDELAEESEKLLTSDTSDKIENLYKDCASSGGARPKALIKIDNEDWIVKFIYSKDSLNSGRLEYEYALCAKRCKINMSEVKLIHTDAGKYFFATKRFDRPKKHMISAASLLEIDFERSLTDYKDLFKLCNILTFSNSNELEMLFRLMCFNVFSHNQDDHLKNFSFLYDDKKSCWTLSPAYDLTNSTTAFGEHTTLVNGKGKDITDADLLITGVNAGINKALCIDIIEQIKNECGKLNI